MFLGLYMLHASLHTSGRPDEPAVSICKASSKFKAHSDTALMKHAHTGSPKDGPPPKDQSTQCCSRHQHLSQVLLLRMPEEVSTLIFVAPALPGNSSGGSFARKIGLGRQLQLLYNRAIMASEGPGLQVSTAQWATSLSVEVSEMELVWATCG